MENTELCAICQRMCLEQLASGRGILHRHVFYFIELTKRETIECNLCRLIWWSLRYDHSWLEDIAATGEVRIWRKPSKKRPASCEGQVHPHETAAASDSEGCVDLLEVVAATASDFEDMLWIDSVGLQVHQSKKIARGELVAYGIRGDPTAPYTIQKTIDTDPASSTVIKMVQEWISDCEVSHEECRDYTKPFLPSRLLDVGDDTREETVYLIETTDLKPTERLDAQYLALSYCWGAKPFLTTTIKSLANSQSDGMDVCSLPATIQDAIWLTRTLGFHYLWVDSLCILQGEDEAAQRDWRKESSAMRSIYGGAFVTISAASAASAWEGFLKRRALPSAQKIPPAARVPYKLTQRVGDPDKQVLETRRGFIMISGRRILVHPSEQPLSRRAWALQESLLSTRLLTFGSSEVTFRCQRCEQRESGPTSWNKAAMEDWHAILEDYTSRDLTRASDRLTAIAGVASYVAERTNMTYVEGLWKEASHSQLLWTHVGKLVGPQREYPFPEAFRAPSWSWASVDGGVRMLPMKHHAPYELLSWRFQGSACAQDPSETGVLGHRALQLRGKLTRVKSVKTDQKGFYDGVSDEACPLVSLGSSLRTYLDRPSLWVRSSDSGTRKYLSDVWFLKLTASAGLLLIPTPERLQRSRWRSSIQWIRQGRLDDVLPSNFERVGVFSCDHETDMQAIFELSEISKILLH